MMIMDTIERPERYTLLITTCIKKDGKKVINVEMRKMRVCVRDGLLLLQININTHTPDIYK